MAEYTSTVRDALGGHEEKPPKKIARIEHTKSHNGDHVFIHHHTHPEHHPDEVHTKRGDDEMVEHMMEHAGDPNSGEPEADAGTPEAYSGPSGAPDPNAAAPAAPDASAGGAPSPTGPSSVAAIPEAQ